MTAFTSGDASIALTNAQLFRSVVHEQYQDTGVLKDAVDYVGNVQGEKYNYPYSEAMELVDLTGTPGTDVEQVDAVFANRTATLEAKGLVAYTRVDFNAKLAFTPNDPIVRHVNKALGRTSDQTVINKVFEVYGTSNNGGISKITNSQIGSGSERLYKAATLAREKLLDNGVDESDCCFVMRSDLHSAFMDSQKITSRDYVDGRPAQTGMVTLVQGFRVKRIASKRGEGGLPANRILAFHRDAIGLAENLGTVRVDWAPPKLAWAIQCVLNTGAAVIDPTGIVVVETA